MHTIIIVVVKCFFHYASFKFNPEKKTNICCWLFAEKTALYQKCLVEMKSLTSTVESACLTTDCWTSRNNESFMAITVHFIDIEFKLKSILLECHPFDLSHTSSNLAQEIERVLRSWELFDKITFAVSDNAMNLIVQSALRLEEDYMICRFVELETSIRGTLGLINNAPDNLRPEEWIILQELIKVLKPFEEATKAISGQKYMTASLVIVIVQGLFNVFSNLLKMDLTQRVLKVAEQLLSNLNSRDAFKHSEKSGTLARCTFLDPRFKHIPFSHSTTLMNTTKHDVIEKTSEIIHSKYTEEDRRSYETETLVHSNSEQLSIWYDIDSCVAKSTHIGTAKSRAIVEVQRYLEDSIIPRCQDPLSWWKDHNYNYPHLSVLARNRDGNDTSINRKHRLLYSMYRCFLHRQCLSIFIGPSKITFDVISMCQCIEVAT